MLVGWLASVALDEFQKGHHAYTVQGQKAVLKTEGRHEKVDGCYQVSGKVHRSSFLLLVFFVLSLAGLWLVNASI